jgi:hypothetical protein
MKNTILIIISFVFLLSSAFAGVSKCDIKSDQYKQCIGL